MANDHYYNVENHQIWFAGKESPFRTLSPQAKDTFAAGITAFPMPIKLRRIPRFYQRKKKIAQDIAGQLDFGYLAHHGVEDFEVTLTGDMYDFSMMYFLTSLCTTTDNTPTGYYTHTYETDRDPSRATNPPSFPMIYKMVNDEAANANDIWVYWSGCVIKKISLSSSNNAMVTCAITILVAKSTVGSTALTTQPTTTIPTVFDAENAVITFTKGGTAVPGKIEGWEISYETGAYLHKAQGEDTPEEALHANRVIKLMLNWRPKYEPDAIVNTDLPTAASDLDCTIKISRDTANDYVEFKFEKLWNMAAEDGTWDFNDYWFQQRLNLIIKPTLYEAGGVLDITEVNSLDDDRYET